MIKGNLDFVDGSKVVGWCVDTDQTDPLRIEIYRNGDLLSDHLARHYRPILHKHKVHPTGHCGFVINLEENAFSDGDMMTVKEKQSGFVIGDMTFPVFKNKIFFMHIAKASGTSLNDFIAGHYANDRVQVHLEGKKDWTQNKQLLFNFDFLSGHLRLLNVMRYHNLKSWLKVTLLRDPLDHLISHLAWVKHVGSNPYSLFFLRHSAKVKELAKRTHAYNFSRAGELEDFMETLTEHDKNLFDNCQTRYFLPATQRGDLTEKDCAAAVRNLAAFNLIGVSECYDGFIEKLCSLKKWPVPQKSKRLNVSQNKFGLTPTTAAQRKVLEKFVRYDYILYRKVIERFDYKTR